MPHPTDIEIARAASKRPIPEIGAGLGIPPRQPDALSATTRRRSRADFIAGLAARRPGRAS